MKFAGAVVSPSPVLMLTTPTGPETSWQEETRMPGDCTTTSVEETERTRAATRSMVAETGDSKPWPKMVIGEVVSLNDSWPGAKEVMSTLLPKRKAAVEMVWKPVLTFLTRTSAGRLARPWPKPRAAGEMTTIRFGVTDWTVASSPTAAFWKKTWTGDTKPWPLIVTVVPPSFGPEVGETEKTCGWSTPPKA